MNVENYLGQQFVQSECVRRTLKSINNKAINVGYPEMAKLNIYNMGVMMGIRRERMARNSNLKTILKMCGKRGRAYKVSNDELKSQGIEKGDIVICQCGLKPCHPMKDFVLYEKKDGGLRMYAYYGCYAYSHWAICLPADKRHSLDFIGKDCIGVISHIFDAKGNLKYQIDTSAYSEEFDTTRTIGKEPPNLGPFAPSNITDLYDVL